MNNNQYQKLLNDCLEKRKETKGMNWNKNVPNTRSSLLIRRFARKELKLHNISMDKCYICGSYAKGMITVAHIISCESFSMDTPLGVIDHIHNLLPSCKIWSILISVKDTRRYLIK